MNVTQTVRWVCHNVSACGLKTQLTWIHARNRQVLQHGQALTQVWIELRINFVHIYTSTHWVNFSKSYTIPETYLDHLPWCYLWKWGSGHLAALFLKNLAKLSHTGFGMFFYEAICSSQNYSNLMLVLALLWLFPSFGSLKILTPDGIKKVFALYLLALTSIFQVKVLAEDSLSHFISKSITSLVFPLHFTTHI